MDLITTSDNSENSIQYLSSVKPVSNKLPNKEFKAFKAFKALLNGGSFDEDVLPPADLFVDTHIYQKMNDVVRRTNILIGGAKKRKKTAKRKKVPVKVEIVKQGKYIVRR
ncbi:MAG: hypothetical protein Satyrvirus9_23 [Satyrvirus sp.]|uniref:Uncharacterized protein n=1 Tax=Satyrvirus sp. TaxID=2487771 RepID=A0A3G5ADQ0_9VIRU|nr:MAG: hypothetical protein Satyrvirus9_23 [Satyrvirus sp.]